MKNNNTTNQEGTKTEVMEDLLSELILLKQEFKHTPTKIHVIFVKIVDSNVLEKHEYTFDTEEEAYHFAEELARSSVYIGLDSWKYTNKPISDIYTFKDRSEVEVLPITYRILIYPVKKDLNI